MADVVAGESKVMRSADVVDLGNDGTAVAEGDFRRQRERSGRV